MDVIPFELHRRALPQTTAELRRRGISARHVASPDYRRLHHGVHVEAAQPPDIETTIRAAGLLVETEGAVGGWAAAWWHGVERLDGRGGRAPVLLCLPRGVRRRHAGITTLRSDLAPTDMQVVGGLRVTSPVRTCFDLVRRSHSLGVQVAAVDAFRASGLVTAVQLAAYANHHHGWLGVGRVITAARLSSDGTESVPESLLRLAWVADAELPEPLVKPTIMNLDGQPVARVDLLDPQAGLVIEYDDGNDGRPMRSAMRRMQLEDLGLTFVGISRAALVGNRRGLIDRLIDARALALGRSTTVPQRWCLSGGRSAS